MKQCIIRYAEFCRMNLCTIYSLRASSTILLFARCVFEIERCVCSNPSFRKHKSCRSTWNWLHSDMVSCIIFMIWFSFVLFWWSISICFRFGNRRQILIQITAALTWKRLIKSCSQPINLKKILWARNSSKIINWMTHFKWRRKKELSFVVVVVIFVMIRF